jgi:hypothetical protein
VQTARSGDRNHDQLLELFTAWLPVVESYAIGKAGIRASLTH